VKAFKDRSMKYDYEISVEDGSVPLRGAMLV
jgi:hypothetical protein